VSGVVSCICGEREGNLLLPCPGIRVRRGRREVFHIVGSGEGKDGGGEGKDGGWKGQELGHLNRKFLEKKGAGFSWSAPG
jgi:hypothetical protein